MPQERLPMRKIRDVLRLKAGGSSKRKIAASLGISPTAVGECIPRARRACLSWPLPASLDDETLESRLYPPPAITSKNERPQPDWPAIHRELKRPGHAADACGRRADVRRLSVGFLPSLTPFATARARPSPVR